MPTLSQQLMSAVEAYRTASGRDNQHEHRKALKVQFTAIEIELKALRASEPKIVGWMNPINNVIISPEKKLARSIGMGYPNFSVPVYDKR